MILSLEKNFQILLKKRQKNLDFILAILKKKKENEILSYRVMLQNKLSLLKNGLLL